MEILFAFVSYLILTGDRVWAADTTYMRTTIQTYFSDVRHHTLAADEQRKVNARTFINDEFTRFGLETHTDTFTDTSYPGATFVNVIGVLKGTHFGQTTDRLMGIGAHYDTVAASKGVDDNGSGMAAMLDVISQLTSSSNTYLYTMIFVAFDAEELGLLGSQNFVNSWFPSFLIQSYGASNAANIFRTGAFILDTLMEYETTANSQNPVPGFETAFPTAYQSINSDGFHGDFVAMIYRESTQDANLAAAFQSAWASAGRPEYEIESFPLPTTDNTVLASTYSEYLRSDHKMLWIGNYPAVFLTDSADYRGDMKTCYHAACDNTATMLTDTNLNFLAKTTDAITAALTSLSTSGSSTIVPPSMVLVTAVTGVALIVL